MLLWSPPGDQWDIINNTVLAESLNSRRSKSTDPSTRIFIAFYTVSADSGASPAETDKDGNYVYYDLEEDGCSVWYCGEKRGYKYNPAPLRDWGYVAGMSVAGAGLAASAFGILYAHATNAFFTQTSHDVAEAAAESMDKKDISPLLKGLVNNSVTRASRKEARNIVGQHFKDGSDVYDYFSSPKYVKRLYRFIRGDNLTEAEKITTAVIVPFGSPAKSPSRTFMQSFAGFAPGTELSFQELEDLRASAGVALSTFASLALGDLNPAGYVVSQTAGNIVKKLQKKTEAVKDYTKNALLGGDVPGEGLPRSETKPFDKDMYQKTWAAVRPIFDTMSDVLNLVGNATDHDQKLSNFELNTVIGSDGNAPSPFFPEKVYQYMSKITSKPMTYANAIEDTLGSTRVGIGCKILGTLIYGEPLSCAAFGDIFKATKFIDQCVTTDIINEAITKSIEAETKAGLAIQSLQNVKDNVMAIAFNQKAGRGNMEWILGSTIAYMAKQYESSNPRAFEDVETQDWFIEMQRWLAGGQSALDRAGGADFAFLWVIRHMLIPLLDPFSTQHGLLGRPCNELADMIHTFAASQKQAYEKREQNLILKINQKVNMENLETVETNVGVLHTLHNIYKSKYVNTWILPLVKTSTAKYLLVESSLKSECRLRVLAHYYPLLPLHCVIRKGGRTLGAAAVDSARKAIAYWNTPPQAEDVTEIDSAQRNNPYGQKQFEFQADDDEIEDATTPLSQTKIEEDKTNDSTNFLQSWIGSFFKPKQKKIVKFTGEQDVIDVINGYMTEDTWNSVYGKPGFTYQDAKKLRHQNNITRLKQQGNSIY